ncbi:MAG: ATP-binding cassette domain-containing protein [Nanobdellota archaeon]
MRIVTSAGNTGSDRILEVRNIGFSKEKKILDGLSFTFEEKKTYAIVGPNGAGKSTIAGVIMGLERYSGHTGKVILDGKDITSMSIDRRAKEGITLSWQEPARYKGLKVKRYLNSDKESMKQSLLKVGLDPDDYLERPIDHNLSGGERKRIELASIILLKPKYVLLDELDSGIDIGAIEKIFEVIDLLKSEGTTVILITHSPKVLERSEYAYLLCHGEIVDKGPSEEIQRYFRDKCLTCTHKNKPGGER